MQDKIIEELLNEFVFYEVIRTVYKGHSHWSYSKKLFCDVEKAIRFAKKQRKGSASIIEIKTFPDGQIRLSVIDFWEEKKK